MKRKLLIVLLAGLLIPTEGTAQKVYKDASNRVVLDSSETGVNIGLPAAAVTSTKKYPNGSYGTVSNTVLLFGTGSTINSVTGSINATVYQKLEVAPMSMGSNTTPTLSTASATMNWTTAFTRCKNLNYNGGTGWRLPTQRELQLLYIFNTAFDSFFGTSGFNSNTYWSATENSETNVRIVNFGNGGQTSVSLKTNSNYARCVREL